PMKEIPPMPAWRRLHRPCVATAMQRCPILIAAWKSPGFPRQLDLDQLSYPVFLAKDTKVACDLLRVSRGLLGIVGKLHRRPAIGLGHLADQRDGIETARRRGRAAGKIIGEIGTPAEGHAHLALEMAVGFDDRVDFQAIGKDEQLAPRIATLA